MNRRTETDITESIPHPAPCPGLHAKLRKRGPYTKRAGGNPLALSVIVKGSEVEPMPLYYFDFQDGGSLRPDDTGLEFERIEDAATKPHGP